MEALAPQAVRRRRFPRLVLPLSLAFVLVCVDLWTKAALITPLWAWDSRRGFSEWLLAVIPIAFLCFRVTMWAGALMLAAWIGNVALADGPIANPFNFDTGTHNVAFNAADAYLFAAFVVLVFSIAERLSRG